MSFLFTKKLSFIFFAAFLIVACQNKSLQQKDNSTWGNAGWIAYEKLPDSLKVVPAVHGSGDELGEKCIQRSVIPLFHKEFTINGNLKEASINISGLGHYELQLNGEKVGDRFLAPGWSSYSKRIFYNTFDVTSELKKGQNAIGVIVGNGFYNINRERYRKIVGAFGYPKLIFNLTLKFEDGRVENIISDETVKVYPSPITFSSIYGGEDYDARLEQTNWNSVAFDDSQWQNALPVDDPLEILEPELDFPLKVMQEFDVQKKMISKSGRTVYDFGQNASGIISLKVKGNKGAQIKIRPDELVNTDGDVTQQSSGGPYEFNYILKGDREEFWMPRFTYYGFRYADVEITDPAGAEIPTEILELKMLHTRNSSPTVGSFSCSDTLFNRIFELINWGIKSNMASVATDCPHREKLGWLEQTHLIGPSMQYNFNIHLLYKKVVNDMMDSQLENGLVPDIAPEYVPFSGGFRDSPEWGSASVIIPWQLYKWYGDKEVLQIAYPMMKKYVEYLQSKAQNNIIDYGLGDWYDLGPNYPGVAQLTPLAVTATSIYFYDLKIIAQTAKLLGYETDEVVFSSLSEEVKDAFLTNFFDKKSGVCSTGSQTAYAMPLYTGMIPEADKSKVFNNLIDSIKKNDYALTSGDVGYHFLVNVLSEYGRSDVLYKMNNLSDRPGYGYQLKMGATALTESWAALSTSSNNHMMLGHLMEWFYAGLGGIYQDKNSIAYEQIIIAPKPVGDINWVKCSYNSVKGIICSEWKREADSFVLNVEIPQKATAKIIIPEQFKNLNCGVVSIETQKPISPEIVDNTFSLEPGKYKIEVN